MIAVSLEAWREANQRYLTALLAGIRRDLERYMADRSGTELSAHLTDAEPSVFAEPSWDLPTPAAIDSLSRAFGLSAFERAILLLCAGVELESKLATLCASLQGGAARSAPTFSLALAALTEPHWSALTNEAPLRFWKLVELGSGEGLTTSPLRIDERILHFLTGLSSLDPRLEGIVRYETRSGDLGPTHSALAESLTEVFNAGSETRIAVRINLHGKDSLSKVAVAVRVGSALGLRPAVIQAADLPQETSGRDLLARIWDREAILTSSALILDSTDTDFARFAQRFVELIHCPLFVITEEPVPISVAPSMLRIHVPLPECREQLGLWQRALGPAADSLAGLETVSSRFRLNVSAIEAVSARVLQHRADTARPDLSHLLWEECRRQSRTRMGDLAERIEPVAAWEDLILPESQKRTLSQVVAHVRRGFTVYEQWGFARRSRRGLGVQALFAGASGTGKTMAAEVLAHELRLDLYRIDLSQVVSKYIGETEKNLRRVFDAAEEGGSILLFDEADALFGKRSEVKDSHDRYANIEVSYLLQRMEAYRGLAILTTNLKSALDPAFLRRLRFVIQFPFPDLPQRVEIWRRAFPPETPTSGLDPARLARLQVTGGSIRNIALHAAFMAADAGEPVMMQHVLMGARTEYAKLEKPLADAEIAGWL